MIGTKHEEMDDLSLPTCAACGRWLIAGRSFCPSHPTAGLSGRRLSGRGSVYSLIVSHTAMSADLAAQVPYTTALIETVEGLRILAHVERGTKVDIGMEVELSLTDVETALPGTGRRVARPV